MGFTYAKLGQTDKAMECIRKMEQRQVVVSWLDIRNAYGSIRHNLIQFALNWFHVPRVVQDLVFDYYDKICAQLKTSKWSTLFFYFDLGLFQGCVLSSFCRNLPNSTEKLPNYLGRTESALFLTNLGWCQRKVLPCNQRTWSKHANPQENCQTQFLCAL